jgi:hypothetical protein
MNGQRPVSTALDLRAELSYIASQADKLSKLVTGNTLPIDTLTILTHHPHEFDYLGALIKNYGPKSKYSHGKTLYIEPVDLEVNGYRIKYLGARAPDSTRPQRGYADFPVDNLEIVAQKYSVSSYINATKSGTGQRMLELRHPDFDVLGYIVEHL